ncbi:MAG TPA: hypothetical protein VFJ85_09855 [Acidimicrobiales bacterium]|nr:hypothetical protein [Acidimicrobiales bacterium]
MGPAPEQGGGPIDSRRWRVLIQALGVDHVFDTGRDSLDDFAADPLVFSHLYPIVGDDGSIDFYDKERLVQPPTAADTEKWYGDAFLPECTTYLVGEEERRFGVEVWRTWTVGDEDRFLEEVVLAVQAHCDTLVSRIGDEVFGQLFGLYADGTVEWFDPDNDLPFP